MLGYCKTDSVTSLQDGARFRVTRTRVRISRDTVGVSSSVRAGISGVNVVLILVCFG